MISSDLLLDEKFFVIDKYNLNLIKNKLYGFTIINEKIIDDTNFHNEKIFGLGSYVLLKKDDEKIHITQDYNGSYGLYVFQKNDYFAISNSFVKLVNFIKYNYKISINKDFANSFISSSLCSLSNKDTLINEIIKIPKNYSIEINIEKKEIKYNKEDYQENEISINSAQGINIIDTWFNNWINLIRKIKSETNNFIVDISGGFDSRIILLLILNSNINLNEVLFNSINDKKHTHKEDFTIAQNLAKKYNFKLNNNILDLDGLKLDNEDSMKLSFYTKLGFHKQMFFKKYIFKNKIYCFTGAGGECLRDYWNSDAILDNFSEQAMNYSREIVESTENIINKEKNYYENNIHNGKSFYEYLYNNIRCPNHFGKSDVESYLSNIYDLNPLLDPLLYKLKLTTDDCKDKNLLYALLFVRFKISLLNFDFDNQRYISKKTIEYAKQINKKYPLKKKVSHRITKNVKEKDNYPENENMYDNGLLYSCDTSHIDNYVKDIFSSKTFKNKFENYFSPKIYSEILKKIQKRDYFPSQDVYAAIAIMKIIDDVSFSSNTITTSFGDYLKLYETDKTEENTLKNMVNDLLRIYNTARLDLKNYGNTNNSIEFLNFSDKDMIILEPEWFNNNEGKGIILNSEKNQISFKIKCINDGKLKLFLRSLDIRDKNNKRFPIYLNYTDLYINNEKIKLENNLITHDLPYVYEKEVKNGEEISFEIKWLPFNNNSIYTC